MENTKIMGSSIKVDTSKIKTISTEMIMTLSAIIDKMEIGAELKSLEVENDDANIANKELGKQLIVLIVSRLYKAKNEVYELIAQYKNISIEQAKKAEIIPIICEILGIEGIKDFLSLV